MRATAAPIPGLHLQPAPNGKNGATPAKAERRQHRLADGRRSRGYVAIEVEAIDAEVSLPALALFMKIRRLIDDREGDGFIKASALKALGVELEIEQTMPALLAELHAAAMLKTADGRTEDVNFLAWCESHARRETTRESWRVRAEASRRDKPRGHKA
jgi:hypothetical protein